MLGHGSPEGPRSSSPVAMDSESSQDEGTGQEATSSEATPLNPAQPGAAYVVSSSPGKRTTEKSRNTVVTSSIGTTTQLGNGAEEREMVVEASRQSEKPTPSSPAPVSTLHNSLPACPSSPPTSQQPDSTVADPQSVSSPAQPKLTNSTTSTTQQENTNEMSSSSDTLSSKQSNIPLGAASPSSPNNSVDESRLLAGSESPQGEERTNAVEIQKPVSTVIEVVDGRGSQSQADEDLEDNFDFLASSGLMKAGPDLSPKPNGPTESERIEKARAEATAALNQFAAATKQNGPV